jgi:hypothetical protein
LRCRAFDLDVSALQLRALGVTVRVPVARRLFVTQGRPVVRLSCFQVPFGIESSIRRSGCDGQIGSRRSGCCAARTRCPGPCAAGDPNRIMAGTYRSRQPEK